MYALDRLRDMAKGDRKIEIVEDETGNTDPKSTFRLIVIQTELERFKYLVRSFVRARIAKVIHLRPYSLCASANYTRSKAN